MKTEYDKAISRDGAITGKGLEAARKVAGGSLEMEPVKINRLPVSNRRPERTRTSMLNPLDTTHLNRPN